MTKITIIYCPCPSEKKALELINKLIGKSLIACGNAISSKSCYMWDGQLCSEGEYIAMMKTSASVVKKATLIIEKLHPYDVPAIISWQVQCNAAYQEWVESQIKEQ